MRVTQPAVSVIEPPVIEAVRDGKCLTFLCPFCRRQHWHGAHSTLCDSCGCELHENYNRRGECTCPVGAGNGHRMAHCTSPRSPWKHIGYVLLEVAA